MFSIKDNMFESDPVHHNVHICPCTFCVKARQLAALERPEIKDLHFHICNQCKQLRTCNGVDFNIERDIADAAKCHNTKFSFFDCANCRSKVDLTDKIREKREEFKSAFKEATIEAVDLEGKTVTLRFEPKK